MIPNDRSPFEDRRLDLSPKGTNALTAELALETAIAAVLDPKNPTRHLSFEQTTQIQVKLTVSSHEDVIGIGATRQEALASLLIQLARLK